MTPALKAMIEAMKAALATQRPQILEEDGPNVVLIDGRVDLEIVARAGLAVLKDAVIDAPQAENVEVYGEPIGGAADAVFCLTIDAILKDTP